MEKFITIKGEVLKQILDQSKFTLVIYGTEWCESCKELLANLNTFCDTHPKLTAVYIDVEQFPSTADFVPFKITSYPTVVYFRKGKYVDSLETNITALISKMVELNDAINNKL